MKKITFTFLMALFSLTLIQAQNKGKSFTVAEQQADFKILKKALERLHPGLTRFNTPQEMEQHFADLQKALQTPQTERSMLRLLSQFTAKIKCSHTYCNPWNIDKGVKKRVYGESPREFPFKFQMVDERMIITKDLSEEYQLKRGYEVLKINGIAMPAIVKAFRTVVKKDGNAFPQQMAQMETYAFDYYFPLFFPTKDTYDLEVRPYQSGKKRQLTVKALTKKEWKANMLARFGKNKTYDDLWSFAMWDNETAYLEIGTYVTWKMKQNWKKRLKNAFATMKAKGAKRLVLDLRGNSGGLTDAAIAILRYLYDRPFKFGEKTLVKNYQAGDVLPYLSTWNKEALNPPARYFKKRADGMYEFLPGKNKKFKPFKNRFKGKVYVLCSAHNGSGGTSTLGHIQEQNLGTIIGQETGGSKEGPIGGQIFYLTLPNTKMEIDLPVMRGYMPIKHPEKLQKDKGVIPDIIVKKSIDDIAKGIDTELEYVKKNLIAREKTEK
ncbi:MAG TPA: hypothetical protein DCS93_40565 [Microscillaceae bacterium]|nr:hypothetical protein [Microscillaceae bacterium]